ncbi:MAG: AarF/UbiB family protein [Solirubrobacteraceae bacterium]
MSDTDPFERLDALIAVGLRLARSAPSGRVALARAAAALHPAWLPRPWGDPIEAELRAAATAAVTDPIAPRRVERVLRDAWGVPPADELDELELEPVAVTPSSQVHRGVRAGNPVAIKLRRPGLDKATRQDLVLLERLSAPLAAAFPALDAGAILAEVRERVLDELDLEHEAAVQRRVHRALRGHPFLTVPAPVSSLARDGVLVSEWIDGVALGQAPDADQAAARLVAFVLGGLTAGIAHADPDPDDVLVLADGRLAILDFGASRTVDAPRAALTAAVFDAFAGEDAGALGDATAALGWLAADRAPAALALIRHALAELAGPSPSRLDVDAVTAVRERLLEAPDELAALLRAGALGPQDLWPARSVAQAFGAIARVGATGSWVPLAQAALRDGWRA